MSNQTIEIRPHRWQERGENYGSDFYVFVNGEPNSKLSDCINCTHYVDSETECKKHQEVGPNGDDKIYPFCGNVCGYFNLKGDVSE